ncbi:MAG: 1-acyl-sn-glycerol-3-phosphate acyltransferase [Chloroflexi bacterium]|jgi:1-acyl-sn-glycerol-3-phosphate acyltransferase|nr:1-acyl-sn-glycerol-3-phosphate acyltransferase [Chloroflexota bacterium]
MKSISRWFMNTAIRLGTDILCRIDMRDFPKVPARGPLILVINHIGSLEVPLLFVHLQPRKMIGLAKIETWDSKFIGWLFDLWDAIPVRRGEADLEAIRACLEVLKAGDILAIAPEGTRSYNGRLLLAQPGIVLIALRSGAPILPMAHWGGEDFGSNLKKLKRTDFHIRVGKLFYLDAKGERMNGEIRQAMADEIMSQIAALMPEDYRGEYANCKSPPKYLRFS